MIEDKTSTGSFTEGVTVRSGNIGFIHYADVEKQMILVYERVLYEHIVESSRKCNAEVCACIGDCMGAKLASLRFLTDRLLYDRKDHDHWWSDQGHCHLIKRYDTDHDLMFLTPENYYKKDVDSKG